MTQPSLPLLIPTRTSAIGVPVSCATRADLEVYAATTEMLADQEARLALVCVEQDSKIRAALRWFKPGDAADLLLSKALAKRGHTSAVVENDQTRGAIEKHLQAVAKIMAKAQTNLEVFAAWALAARQALALYRDGDPPETRYGDVLGRTRTRDAPSVVNVHMPTPEPRTKVVELHRRPDGSSYGTVTEHAG